MGRWPKRISQKSPETIDWKRKLEKRTCITYTVYNLYSIRLWNFRLTHNWTLHTAMISGIFNDSHHKMKNKLNFIFDLFSQAFLHILHISSDSIKIIFSSSCFRHWSNWFSMLFFMEWHSVFSCVLMCTLFGYDCYQCFIESESLFNPGQGAGLLGRRRLSVDLPSFHLFMWTTNQKLGSDRPSHGQIRTLDQDYYFEVDGFLTTNRPSGQIEEWTTDH